MKKNFYIAAILIALMYLGSCQPEKISDFNIGPSPSEIKVTVIDDDPYKPIFVVNAKNGFIYHWEMGNGQKIAPGKDSATSYYPFAGTYEVSCTIYGAGAKKTVVTTTYVVEITDESVMSRPIWKELTGGGKGRTWIYNTDPESGFPDYCYQTWNDLDEDPQAWAPQNSWGQCEQITPDIEGAMVFDLDNGINYTYHHVAGDQGIKGTFVLNTDNNTITIDDPYILDHDIDCTNPEVTSSGTYKIVLLTDDQLILWQDQKDGETGWAWSFKRKD